MNKFFSLLMVLFSSVFVYAKTVTLVPEQTYHVVTPMQGTTQVSASMFDALITNFGVRDRIVDAKNYKLKSCLIFSCDENLQYGKIFNITDYEIVVNVKCYFPHDIYESDIVVKPRTFSRMNSGGWPNKIVCTF